MRRILIALVAATLWVCAASRAEDVTWFGLNVNGGTGDGDVDTLLNWDTGSIPNSGDTAIFSFNADEADLTVVSNAIFNPGRIVYNANLGTHIGTRDLIIDRPLDMTDITMTGYNTGSSSRDTDRLQIGINNPVTWNLSGETPLNRFINPLARWKFILLGTGTVTLNLTGPSIVFPSNTTASATYLDYDSYNIRGGTEDENASHDTNSVIRFTADGGTVALKEQGKLGATLGMRTHRLAVRSNQTWTCDENAFISFTLRHDSTGGTGPEIIECIDGNGLPNLGEVNLYLVRQGGDNGTLTTGPRLLPGMYGSAFINAGNTSTRDWHVVQAGDVTFTREAVQPPYTDSTNSYAASTMGHSLVVNHGYLRSRTRWYYVVNGFTLEARQGILIEDLSDANTGSRAELVADGSTVICGGDLTIWSQNGHGANALAPTRQVGVRGDTGTVFRIAGDFVTNTRSFDLGDSFHETTVTMNGGGATQTWEVADASFKSGVQTDSWSVDTLNIGDGTTNAAVMLVNNFLNDNPIVNGITSNAPQSTWYGEVLLYQGVTQVTDIATSPALDRIGEKLIVNTLSIAAGSVLNVNAQVVEVGQSLNVNGQLDLNNGAGLESGTVLTNFYGLSDQTAAWSSFRSRVVDSSNPTFTFSPTYILADDRTCWQAAGPPKGIIFRVR